MINLAGYDDVNDAQRLFPSDRVGVELIAYKSREAAVKILVRER